MPGVDWQMCLRSPGKRSSVEQLAGLSPSPGFERVHRELDHPVRRAVARRGVPLADEHPHLVERRTRRDVAAVGLREPVVIGRRQAFDRIGPGVGAAPPSSPGRCPARSDRTATRTSMLPVLALKYDSTVLPSIWRTLISPTWSGHSGVGGLFQPPPGPARPALPSRPVGERLRGGAVEHRRAGPVEAVGHDVHPAGLRVRGGDRVVVAADLRLPPARVGRGALRTRRWSANHPVPASAFTSREVCGTRSLVVVTIR